MSQRLNAYFGASPELRRLAGSAGQLRMLQQCYEEFVPLSLARASRVVQLERQRLTIYADNGAVAAKLRQLLPELTRLFQSRGCEVTGIQVRVQVAPPRPFRRAAAAVPLSAGGQVKMLDALNDMRDSPLKSALRKLAEKAAKRER